MPTPPSSVLYNTTESGIVTLTCTAMGRTAREFFEVTSTESRTDRVHLDCRATAVGTKYGVAKRAKVYSVKVLGDDGNGDGSDM